MTHPAQTFDWTAWYAKIPGIPADWGFAKNQDQTASRQAIVPPGRRRSMLRLAR